MGSRGKSRNQRCWRWKGEIGGRESGKYRIRERNEGDEVGRGKGSPVLTLLHSRF